MKRSIRKSVTYPYPVAKVWHALTTPELLAKWLMPNDFQPVKGHKFTMRTDPAPGFDGVVHCEVLEIEPPNLLRFAWRGGPLDTVLTLRLAEVAGGTRLDMEHAGFEGARAIMVSFILGPGWKKILRKHLPGVLNNIDVPACDAGLAERVIGHVANAMPGK